MKFSQPDYPKPQQPKPKNEKDLTEAVAEEHPKHIVSVAEQQIMAMHSHSDGSAVELHQIGSREFIAQSMRSSLEGKLGGSDIDGWQQQLQQNPQNNIAAAKIEYEKRSSQNEPMQSYGAQHSVTGAAVQGGGRHETAMVGCNCGAEWTVTGQSMKTAGEESGAIKIQSYSQGSQGGGEPGGYRAGGGGGAEYHTGAGTEQNYNG